MRNAVSRFEDCSVVAALRVASAKTRVEIPTRRDQPSVYVEFINQFINVTVLTKKYLMKFSISCNANV